MFVTLHVSMMGHVDSSASTYEKPYKQIGNGAS
jgi:hypothetical protein